ncbi:MAG: hypothetical protein RLZZ104_2036 [Pseudomonadota bacterium]
MNSPDFVKMLNDPAPLISQGCCKQLVSNLPCPCCFRAGQCCLQATVRSEDQGDFCHGIQVALPVPHHRESFLAWLQSQFAKLLRLYRGQQ